MYTGIPEGIATARVQMSTLEQLIDIEAIKRLMSKYSYNGDTKNFVEFRKLFTDDAIFIFEGLPRLTRDGPTSLTFTDGPDAFISGQAAMIDNIQMHHKVFLPNITITSPTTAKGVWALHDYLKLPNCIFNGYGHYHHDYVKGDDGEWRISRNQVTRTFVEEQWLDGEAPAVITTGDAAAAATL